MLTAFLSGKIFLLASGCCLLVPRGFGSLRKKGREECHRLGRPGWKSLLMTSEWEETPQKGPWAPSPAPGVVALPQSEPSVGKGRCTFPLPCERS